MTISDIWIRKRSICDSGVLRGSKDMHSHILYGVDDGIADADESLAALAYEEYTGISEVWCTPHIMEEVPNETAALEDRFSQLQDLYKGPIILHLAAEYMLDNLFLKRLRHGDILKMSNDVILVETSTAGAPYRFDSILADIMSEGFHPLLAHPERYTFLKMIDYLRLREMGVLFQLNIGSLTGFYGKEVRVRAETLLMEKMYCAYGSDCHSVKRMEFQYSEARLSADVLRRISLIDDNI